MRYGFFHCSLFQDNCSQQKKSVTNNIKGMQTIKQPKEIQDLQRKAKVKIAIIVNNYMPMNTKYLIFFVKQQQKMPYLRSFKQNVGPIKYSLESSATYSERDSSCLSNSSISGFSCISKPIPCFYLNLSSFINFEYMLKSYSQPLLKLKLTLMFQLSIGLPVLKKQIVNKAKLAKSYQISLILECSGSNPMK